MWQHVGKNRPDFGGARGYFRGEREQRQALPTWEWGVMHHHRGSLGAPLPGMGGPDCAAPDLTAGRAEAYRVRLGAVLGWSGGGVCLSCVVEIRW